MWLFLSRHVPSANSDGNVQNASQYRSFRKFSYFVSLTLILYITPRYLDYTVMTTIWPQKVTFYVTMELMYDNNRAKWQQWHF